MSSNPISLLNEISAKSHIEMKFEKHPTVQTGSILYFGGKVYEATEASIKRSRLAASEQALSEYLSNSDHSSYESSSVERSSISELTELSQKLKKNIDINFTPSITHESLNYICSVSFLGLTATAKSRTKKEAKEKAYRIILDQINHKNAESSGSISSLLETSEDSKKSSDFKSTENISDIIPRDYQEEIFNIALNEDVIICMGTGTGKTFITVLLSRKFALETFGPFKKAKRIVFLASTTALVQQQGEYFTKHTNLKIGTYCGDSLFNTWSGEKWIQAFNDKNMLFMTPEICRQLLQHKILDISDINLFIIDECHHGINSGHPYNVIMTLYYGPKKDSNEPLPRVIGLSASPALNCKIEYTYCSHIIKERIENLEKVYHARVITAVDCANSLKKFISNPEINVILFKKDYPSILTDNILTYLVEYKTNLGNYCSKIISENSILIQKTCGSILTPESTINNLGQTHCSPEKFKKHTIKAMNRCINVLLNFGIYPLLSYLRTLDNSLKSILKNSFYERCEKIILKFSKYIRKLTIFLDSKIQHTIDLIHEKTIENICNTALVTGKIKTMFLTLCKHYPVHEELGKCGLACTTIVFANERSTCEILSSLANEFSAIESRDCNHEPRFSSNFVVGVSDTTAETKISCGISQMNLKNLNARIKAFHHGAYNILFATKILEEGIDIQSCNIVIRFDIFSTLHSFIQSKGRIRRNDSTFYLLAEEELAKDMKIKMSKYQNAHTSLENILRDFSICKHDDVKESSLVVSEILKKSILYTSQTQIDLRGSISFIYRYCDLFSCSAQYPVRPRFYPEYSEIDLKMHLQLPIETGFSIVTSSDWFEKSNTKLAKQQAALKAIEFLYKNGKLDECLVPVSRVVKKISLQSDSDVLKESKLCTDEIKNNFYLKKIPEIFNLYDSNLRFYKLKINFSDFCFCDSHGFNLSKLDFSKSDFGCLIPKNSPNFSFPIASSTFNVQISIIPETQNEIILLQEEYDILKEFNKMIFNDLLNVVPYNCLWDPEESNFILLSVIFKDGHQIDYDKINDFINFYKLSLDERRMKIPFNNNNINSPIVIKKYSNDESLFSVINIDEVSPLSKIPGTGFTYIQYFKSKWSINLLENEVLLTCFCIPKNMNLLKRIHHCKKRKSNCFHLPTSCISQFPLDTNLLLKFKMLPSILKRFCDFVNIFEWSKQYFDVCLNDVTSKSLNSFIHFQCSQKNGFDIVQKFCLDQSFNYFYQRLGEYWNQNNYKNMIEFRDLFIAFSRASSSECCDNERMELLGDCLIKLITTMVLFADCPPSSVFMITKLRSSLVSNENFFEIGLKHKVESIMNSKLAKYGMNWRPPFCVVKDEKFHIIHEEAIDYQFLTEKAIADVVESLIGCVFISTNMRFLYDFCIKMDIFKNAKYDNKFETFDQVLEAFKKQIFEYDQIDELYSDITYIEETLKYEFVNKNILAQALIHSSSISHSNKINYDRLELFGDAIIGVIMVIYLYLQYDEPYNWFSPFFMTQFQHALVNNKILGIISAKNGFIRCMQVRSYELHSALIRFMNSVECIENSQNIKEVPYLGIICEKQIIEETLQNSISIEVIPCPKPAGDILESLIGAVFVDTQCDIIKTAKIFMPFFQTYIEKYISNIPKQPKVYVMENYQNLIKSMVKLEDLRYKSIIKTEKNDFEYIGIASTMDEAFLGSCYALMNFEKK